MDKISARALKTRQSEPFGAIIFNTQQFTSCVENIWPRNGIVVKVAHSENEITSLKWFQNANVLTQTNDLSVILIRNRCTFQLNKNNKAFINDILEINDGSCFNISGAPFFRSFVNLDAS